MNLYSSIVFLHVATAIFGLGPLTILAGVVSGPASAQVPLDRVATFMRIVGISLGAMFVTGAILIALTHGALGEARWVRVSFGLFVVLGLLHGLARRRLKRAQTGAAPLPGLGGLLWSMCGVVAAITYLMEAKPW